MREGAPIVVLLGTEVAPSVRAVLDALVERDDVKVLAITPASAPTDDMASIFSLQMSAERALAGS
jgi:hypothetical protein